MNDMLYKKTRGSRLSVRSTMNGLHVRNYFSLSELVRVNRKTGFKNRNLVKNSCRNRSVLLGMD